MVLIYANNDYYDTNYRRENNTDDVIMKELLRISIRAKRFDPIMMLDSVLGFDSTTRPL